jgi:flagellar motor switch protein FliN/FliY
MSVLESISVELSVVLGSTQMPVRQVLKMGRGAVIPLDCGEDDPTLVYVNDQLVARGRIVVRYENMSIEITDVVRRAPV